MSWERNVCPNSPPRLGGVAAPPRKCSRSLLAQTGWYGMARSHLIDTRVALLIQSVRFANIYKVASHHGSTARPFAKKRANGTPPNLGGEFFAHLEQCPNSSVRSETAPTAAQVFPTVGAAYDRASSRFLQHLLKLLSRFIKKRLNVTSRD